MKTTNFRELDVFFWFSDFLDSYSLADSKIEMCGFPKRLEQIFKIEDSLAKKSVEERYQKRLELEKPVLDELFAWAEKLYVTPKSKLGEAADYPA